MFLQTPQVISMCIQSCKPESQDLLYARSHSRCWARSHKAKLKELSVPSNVSSLVCATGVVRYHLPMELGDVKWMFAGMSGDGSDSNTN